MYNKMDSSYIINNFGQEIRDNIFEYKLNSELGSLLKVDSVGNNILAISLVAKNGDIIDTINIPITSTIVKATFDENTYQLSLVDSINSTVICDLSALNNSRPATKDEILNLYK